ncbi:hypothetical protein Leryth_023179 [Lithospermum erythrorhizon]|nr:hypothetical protein Leryth_023179 [Lithospermum erythrorhizon]
MVVSFTQTLNPSSPTPGVAANERENTEADGCLWRRRWLRMVEVVVVEEHLRRSIEKAISVF